jgi:hypothetical protein
VFFFFRFVHTRRLATPTRDAARRLAPPPSPSASSPDAALQILNDAMPSHYADIRLLSLSLLMPRHVSLPPAMRAFRFHIDAFAVHYFLAAAASFPSLADIFRTSAYIISRNKRRRCACVRARRAAFILCAAFRLPLMMPIPAEQIAATDLMPFTRS